jgi:phosphoglucosamine mutase
MDRRGALFGGEPSGHVIFREYGTTGDGILTALEVLSLAHAERRPLADLASEIERWPQVLMNVRVARRKEWQDVRAFRDEYERAKSEVEKGGGRINVRPSGTEPVLRILVEARAETVASSTAQRLAALAQEVLA